MSNAITKPNTAAELDERLDAAIMNLQSLATSFDDDELEEQVLTLAQLTQPSMKGMEDEQRKTIARLILCQNITNSDAKPAECKPGQFFSSTGEVVGNEITFFPIKGHRVRVKWNDEGIECRSLDGKVGSRHGSCESCPWGRFEKGVRPECSPGYSYYVVTTDLKALYRIDFMKSSANAGRNIQKLALPPALWSRSFTLSSEHKKEASRNYYMMKVLPTGQRTGENEMKICDALHDIFDASYKRALLAQDEYVKRMKAINADGSINTTGESIKISDNDDEVLNFSDSM